MYELVFDKRRKVVRIGRSIQITGTGFYLMSALAAEHLRAAGLGLDLLDYPLLDAGTLAASLSLQSEEILRRNISRTRTILGTRFASAELKPEDGKELIETIPWGGYRLRPDRVRGRIVTDS